MTQPGAGSTAGIVDSHVHLWDPRVLDYPWLRGGALERRFGPTELHDDAGGDLDFVVVQADCLPAQGLREVDWIDGLNSDRIVGIVAFAPLERGEAAVRYLATLRQHRLLVGIRRLLQDERPGFTRTPGFREGLSALSDVDLPFDVCVRHHQLPEVVEMVDATPRVSFVLDHLGKPAVGRPDAAWRDQLSRLAELPNVVCKLSGLTTETVPGDIEGALIQPYIRHALEVFGPARCMFGSDWPVVTTRSGHRWWRDLIEDTLSGWAAHHKAEVMGGTARRIYRLTPTERSEETP